LSAGGAQETINVVGGRRTYPKTPYLPAGTKLQGSASVNPGLPPGWSIVVFRTGEKDPAGNFLRICTTTVSQPCVFSRPTAVSFPNGWKGEERVGATLVGPDGKTVVSAEIVVNWQF
jgi:hypothetical protein